MTKLPLTKRQQQIMDWILEQDKKHDVCPKFSDLTAKFKVSGAQMSRLVNEIVRKGHLEKDTARRWEIWINE